LVATVSLKKQKLLPRGLLRCGYIFVLLFCFYPIELGGGDVSRYMVIVVLKHHCSSQSLLSIALKTIPDTLFYEYRSF
jgi:hypothetical protein